MERGRYPRRKATIQRIGQWRSQRGGHGRGSRIPEELWCEAIEMARVEGVWATSRTLRLNYNRLLARVNRSTALAPAQVTDTSTREGVDGPTFVEMEMVPARSGSRKAVVELVSRNGDRMHVEVADGEGLDLVSLTRAFLEARS